MEHHTRLPETVRADRMPDTAFFAEGADNAMDLPGLEERYTARYHGAPISLTWRQEAFCRLYAELGNGAEAARRAGYTANSARQTAWENLQKSPVRMRIAQLRQARVRRVRQERHWLALHYLLAHEAAMTGATGVASRIRALDRLAALAGHGVTGRVRSTPALAPLLPPDASPDDPDLPDHARDLATDAQHAFAGNLTRDVLFGAVAQVLGDQSQGADLTEPDKTLHLPEISADVRENPLP